MIGDLMEPPVENTISSRLLVGEETDPHRILGLHALPDGSKVIRVWRPGAPHLHIQLKDAILPMTVVHPAGLFELTVPSSTTAADYHVYYSDGRMAHDCYTFLPTFGEVDQYLFAKGVHYDLYRAMGARVATHQGVQGVRFVVWAPNACRVSVVGDFNHWDGLVHPMRCLGNSGVWELFLPGIGVGEKYKFEIKTHEGAILLKADPYALQQELRPRTASIVADVDRYQWHDSDWMARRVQEKDTPKPINVYEVHLGSWRTRHGQSLQYRELAVELAAYCKEMGYTHLELLPVSEHPYDESWGYQVTGYYAATSRYGTPEDFQFFVDYLHQQGIGIIIDWVPGHFPSDDFALAQFDGSYLYEHDDSRQRLHPHWSTHIFNFGRHEVTNFLIANALFWCDRMHIDGLRVDAVASMVYLDYGREKGDWIPNQYGGNENLAAIEFLKQLNTVVHETYPGVLTIAEESSSFLGVTHPLKQGGLGFDMKWNMGWMNDTLRYFAKDPIYRSYHHNDLTFGLLYAFSERFMLVLSHDEIVHGKRSLLSKMPGDMWQKFANLRLLLSYMMCQPGKKLLFMGGEIGQWNEWYCKQELEWGLLAYPTHHGIQVMAKELNALYLTHRALWERDFDSAGFQWVDFSDVKNCIISYLRKGSHEELLCIHNFTPAYHQDYVVWLSNLARVEELFNSDAEKFGGSGKQSGPITIVNDENQRPIGIKLSIPPLATLILRVKFV
jgi:1,4-alpha-glucan branching enzyme